MHDRDGEPETAFAACLLRRRSPGLGHSTATATTAAALCEGEWVGRPCASTPKAASASPD